MDQTHWHEQVTASAFTLNRYNDQMIRKWLYLVSGVNKLFFLMIFLGWTLPTMWFLYLRNFSYVLFSLKWKSNCWVKSGFERLLISDLSQHWWFIKHIILTIVSSTIKKCKILLFVFRQPTSFLGIRHKRNKLNHQNVNSEK